MRIATIALPTLATLAIACTSPTAQSCPPNQSLSLALVDGQIEWHAKIDSLVAAVPGDEERMGVAYGGVTPDEINATGLRARHQFVAMPAVSFEGRVELFPALKDVPTIQNVYLGDPNATAERFGGC